MKAMKLLGRPTLGTCVGLLAGAATLALAVAANAGTGPTLTMTGGTGVPGGSVGATLSISNSLDEAVSAAVDVGFDGDVLDLQFSDCAIASRLEDTHQLGGRVTGDTPDRRLVLDVFVQGTPEVLPPLGDGDLVTCQFSILPGVPTGSTSLVLADPLVGDDQGMPIEPVQLVDGVIVIGEAPTPTPTATSTPTTPAGTPTSTATVTGGVDTPTATPTNTGEVGTPTNTPPATATNTPPPTATVTATETEVVPPTNTPTRTNTPRPSNPEDDDSCAIVPASQVNPWRSLMLLVVPALLLWGRRRRV